ncbi:site-specific integrase [Luteimonas lutimaris]
MPTDQLDEITRRYLAASFEEIEERLALEWEEPGLDAHRFDLNDEAHRLAALLAHADPGEFLDTARAMLPEAEADTLRKLARRLTEAKLEATTAELRALAGKPLQRPQTATAGALREEPKETPEFSEVARAYADERVSLGKWAPRTEHQNRAILATTIELMGDPRIGEVTKDDVRELGRAIRLLPANMGKKWPDKGPRDVLEITEGDPEVARLAPRSVNKYQQLVRSVFAWAMEGDTITKNPATVLKDMEEGDEREDRGDFTDDDLRAYFAELDKEPDRPELHWIPRILAYSGMRLGEAAQLTREDVRQEGDTWVFDINDDDPDKQLKTKRSRRLVPVHSRLWQMGLREFLDSKGPGFLFDAEWRTTDNPKRGRVDALSKLLNRRLESAGIDDPDKTGAHSFRHTVTTRLAEAGAPEHQLSDLLGHKNKGVTMGRYTKATKPATLAEVIELLHLPV